jgi:hypothetical protein
MVRHCWVAVALLGMTSGTAFSQTYTAPRTAFGAPDIGGVWSTRFITRIERPEGYKTLVPAPSELKKLTEFLLDIGPVGDPDIEHQAITSLSEVRGEKRTSIIVEPADGQIPFTEKGLKLVERSFWLDEHGYDNPEERGGFERCIAGFAQPPIRQIPIDMPTQIVQTRDSLAFNTEDVVGFRMVHMNQPPPPGTWQTLEGYSYGRWEGDTLVIDTTLTRADDPFRGHFGRPILVQPTSHVIEKLTRISDTELLYQFTVEDPDLYTKPWLGEYVFHLTKGAALEYACHEGNYSIVNMLKSGRVADAKKAMEAQKVAAKPAPKAKPAKKPKR